jgi:extradiol dioxygenase family protein
VVDRTPLQIRDVSEARCFYQEVLGCSERSAGDPWLEFNLHGHRIVCRLDPQLGKRGRVVSQYHLVDDKYVPIAHCGLALEKNEWRALAKRLKRHQVKVVMESYRRTKSAPSVEATLLLQDPSGNALEVQSDCGSAEACLRCERQRALVQWMVWPLLMAFVVCGILLLIKISSHESAAEKFYVAARPPSCASAGSCLR